MVGGISGALMAAIAAFGVVKLTDTDSTPVTTTAAAVATPLSTTTFDIPGVLAKVGNAVVSIDVCVERAEGLRREQAGNRHSSPFVRRATLPATVPPGPVVHPTRRA